MGARRRQDSGKFRGRYYDRAGVQHEKLFDRQQDARDWEAVRNAEVVSGDWVDPKLRKLRFKAVAESWLETVDVSPKVKINIRGRLDLHLIPIFQYDRIGDIDQDDIQAAIRKLKDKGLAAATVRANYSTLRQIFERAVTRKLIPSSPCVGIKLPPMTKPNVGYLSPDAVFRLADCIHPRFKTVIIFAAFSGLRAGEIWGLKLEHCNLLKGTVEVVQSLSEVNGVQTVKQPKTEGSTRTVRIPRFICELLSEHVRLYPGREGIVFSAPRGGWMSHSTFRSRYFEPALEKAGLDVRFHDLRHSAASILHAEGWTAVQLQKHLGHSRVSTTMDVYCHLYADHDDHLMDALDAKYRGLKGETRAEDKVVGLNNG